ncbi:MAG: hypothetical protein ABEN55_06720 [Bradymonadaceae bacterium]
MSSVSLTDWRIGWTEDDAVDTEMVAILNALEVGARKAGRPIFRLDYASIRERASVSDTTISRRLNKAETLGWIERQDGLIELTAPQGAFSERKRDVLCENAMFSVKTRCSERKRHVQRENGGDTPCLEAKEKTCIKKKNSDHSSEKDTTTPTADAGGRDESDADTPSSEPDSSDDIGGSDPDPEPEPDDANRPTDETPDPTGDELSYEGIWDLGDEGEFVLELARHYGFHFSPKGANGAAMDVLRQIPDDEARRIYIDRKLRSLSNEDYSSRQAHDYLCEDAGEWWAEHRDDDPDDSSGARHETVIDPDLIDEGGDGDDEPDQQAREPPGDEEDDDLEELREEYGDEFIDEYKGLL